MGPRTFVLTMAFVAALCWHLDGLLAGVAVSVLMPFGCGELALGAGLPPGAGLEGGLDRMSGPAETAQEAAERKALETAQLARLSALRDALNSPPPKDAAWLALREKVLSAIRQAGRGGADTGRPGQPSTGRPTSGRKGIARGTGGRRGVPGEGTGGSTGSEAGFSRRTASAAGNLQGRIPRLKPGGGWHGWRPAPSDGADEVFGSGGWNGWHDWRPAPVPIVEVLRRRAAEKRKGGPKPVPAPPPKLRAWLGKGPLKPPSDKLKAPDFEKLKKKFPARLPDGSSPVRKDPGPVEAEELEPPDERADYQGWLYKDELSRGASKPHWHGSRDGTLYFHVGRTWARPLKDGWAWLVRGGDHWWTRAADANSGQTATPSGTAGPGSGTAGPDAGPAVVTGQALVRHSGRWWWRTRDGWFMLHDGGPWAWRYFDKWKRSGLIHPASGTKIVYSEDNTRVAVITGRRVSIFDARTGFFLGSYTEGVRQPM